MFFEQCEIFRATTGPQLSLGEVVEGRDPRVVQEAQQVALVLLGADAIEEALVVGIGETAIAQMVGESCLYAADLLVVAIAATQMKVEKNYVDTHGQSEVAFAFCRLLGFQLLPRLKGINRQRLYRPETGKPDDFAALQPVLSRPIDWELIGQQYDEMV